jgi:bleomycin hydrolase
MKYNKYRTYIVTATLGLTTLTAFSQKEKKNHNGYLFSDIIRIENTPVISQQQTGTCWSFSTTSFLESELIRQGIKDVDLSEMYQVRQIYVEKALNYVRRQGKTQFGEGSLSHDVIRSAKRYGVVPQSIYIGKNYEGDIYQHAELDAILKHFLDGVVSNPNGKLSNAWLPAYEAILDTYLGEAPKNFEVDGKSYTPQSYAQALKLELNNYVTITSFQHLDMHELSVLQIPDNWASESYLNVTLDEFMQAIDHALKNGYTLAWDADVSEKTWVTKTGVSIIPEIPYKELSRNDRDSIGVKYLPELSVTAEIRELGFNSYETTDDHLMHIIGKGQDTKGNSYYIVKNSWGEGAGIEGYHYVSESYMRMKSIGVMMHKDALPTTLQKLID